MQNKWMWLGLFAATVGLAAYMALRSPSKAMPEVPQPEVNGAVDESSAPHYGNPPSGNSRPTPPTTRMDSPSSRPQPLNQAPMSPPMNPPPPPPSEDGFASAPNQTGDFESVPPPPPQYYPEPLEMDPGDLPPPPPVYDNTPPPGPYGDESFIPPPSNPIPPGEED